MSFKCCIQVPVILNYRLIDEFILIWKEYFYVWYFFYIYIWYPSKNLHFFLYIQVKGNKQNDKNDMVDKYYRYLLLIFIKEVA